MDRTSPVYQPFVLKACEHCGGMQDCERWCILENANVYYAFNITLHPEQMTEQDRIILHALSVAW